MIVLLELITLGAYGPYWYLRRRASFHSLSSEQHLPEVALFLVLVVAIVSAALTVASLFPSDPSTIVTIFNLLDILIAAATIFFAFRVRGILRDHLASKGIRDAGISGFWTFFFNLFYLQYKINRIPQQLAAVDEGIRDEFLADKRFERALELGDEGKWQEAIAEFDAALSLNPDNVNVHAQRGFEPAPLFRTPRL